MTRSKWLSLGAVCTACVLLVCVSHGQEARPPAPSAAPPQPGAVRPEGTPPRPPEDAAYVPTVKQAFGLLGDGRVDEMLGALNYGAPYVTNEAREEARRRLTAVRADLGKYDGFDIIGSKPVTARFQQVYAFAYFERRPVLITIQFYQFNNRWRAQDLAVTTDVTQFMETLPLEFR